MISRKVPVYQELTVHKVLDMVRKNNADIMNYLPDLPKNDDGTEKVYRINREYFFNVVNTLAPDFFPNAIQQIEDDRKTRRNKEEEDFVNCDNDIYEVIKSMTANFRSKSKTARALHLLKDGTKKRKQRNQLRDIPINPAFIQKARNAKVFHTGTKLPSFARIDNN